jgi:hypothetical protein
MGKDQSGKGESLKRHSQFLVNWKPIGTHSPASGDQAIHEERSNGEDPTGWLAVVIGFPFRGCLDGKLLIEPFSNRFLICCCRIARVT